MPFIKKRFDFTNYSNTTATFNVPNINGTNYAMLHMPVYSDDINQAIQELLDEANIAYTMVNTYTYDIWGVQFTILGGAYRTSSAATMGIVVYPYGNCQFPVSNNQVGTNSGNASNRRFNRMSVSSSYFIMHNTADANKIDFTLYLYYNENTIHFKIRETDNAGNYYTPIFYISKGITIDNHDCAILGGTPCGVFTYGDNDYNGWRHLLFNLTDIPHLFGICYRTDVENVTPFRAVNTGQFGEDYLLDNLTLVPVSNDCYRGYVKIPNLYYVDYYICNRDNLWDKIIEINGEQYYIPMRTCLSGANTYEAVTTDHPIAIKL